MDNLNHQYVSTAGRRSGVVREECGLGWRGNERDSTMVGPQAQEATDGRLEVEPCFYFYGGLELPEREKMLPILFHKLL